jgi:hypothetical protein
MTIYLDMDGVLADFFGGIEQHFGINHWKDLGDVEAKLMELKGTDFFNLLEPFPTTLKLIDYVKSTGDWGICSSPLRNDEYNSAYWKRIWLESHLICPPIMNLIFTHRKHRYAVDRFTGQPNILIDDKPSNCADWEANGGIAIRYQANQDDFEEYLLPKIDDALDLSEKLKYV